MRTCHALITPWPISSGLHTWCGYRADNERVVGDDLASAPEAVTCPECIRSMKQALTTLCKWVPRLGEEKT